LAGVSFRKSDILDSNAHIYSENAEELITRREETSPFVLNVPIIPADKSIELTLDIARTLT
jgi:hypothetical protein